MSLLSLSMESQVEGEQNVLEGNLGGVEQDAQDNTESVETELLQVNEQTERMIEDVETVSDGMDAQDTVEREIAVLESLAANGGLNQNGAVLLSLHIESWNRMYGIPGLFSLGVAVESFGPSNGATQLSYGLEGVKERASAIWKKLKEIFTNLTRRIKEFFQGLFNGIKKMEFRIRDLREKVKKADFDKPKEPLKDSKYADQLLFEGKTQNILVSAETTSSMLNSYLSFGKNTDKLMEQAFELAEKRITNGADKASYDVDFGHSISDASVVKQARAKSNISDGTVTGFSLPGNVYLCMVANKERTDIKFNYLSMPKPKGSRADVELLNKNDSLRVLDYAEKIFDAGKSMNEYSKKATERRETLIEKLEKYFDGKELEASNDSEKSKVAEAQKSIRDVAKFSQETVDKPFLYIGKYALNQLKVYLDLVEKSVKNGESAESKEVTHDGKGFSHKKTEKDLGVSDRALPSPKEDKKD